MVAVSAKLKELRLRSGLSTRQVSSRVGYDGNNGYVYYESASFKKPLPLDLARRIADVFAETGIEREEVLALAGLNDDEAAHEADALAANTTRQAQVMMPVTLPSEEALTQMFLGFLRVVDLQSDRGEIARILARRLPSGLGRTLAGRLTIETDIGHDPDEPPQSPAKGRRSQSQSSHT